MPSSRGETLRLEAGASPLPHLVPGAGDSVCVEERVTRRTSLWRDGVAFAPPAAGLGTTVVIAAPVTLLYRNLYESFYEQLVRASGSAPVV